MYAATFYFRESIQLRQQQAYLLVSTVSYSTAIPLLRTCSTKTHPYTVINHLPRPLCEQHGLLPQLPGPFHLP